VTRRGEKTRKPHKDELRTGEESVWDYPRPPRLERSPKRAEVYFAGERIADSRRAVRILETSHPPVFYIPEGDVRTALLTRTEQRSFCEFKGGAVYWTLLLNGQTAQNAAWSYPKPTKGFEAIQDYLAFYPSRVEACLVDGERVQAQAGDFYGGWLTAEIKGPFKGEPGTWGW